MAETAAAEGRKPYMMVSLSDWYQCYQRYVIPWSSLITNHAPPGVGKHAQLFRVSLPGTIPEVRSKAMKKRLPRLYDAIAKAYNGEKSKEQTFAEAMRRLGGRLPTEEDFKGNLSCVYVNMTGRDWR